MTAKKQVQSGSSMPEIDTMPVLFFLDPGMRLGEGTGGALAISIIKGAVRVLKEVLTFAEAGVADKEV